MTTPHRAKPELWAAAKKFSQNSMDMLNCLLELRSRIEALEAAQLEAPMTEPRAAITKARPAGLVERVGNRLPLLPDGRVDDKAACAVIHEVAAWLEDQGADLYQLSDALNLLEQEADRG